MNGDRREEIIQKLWANFEKTRVAKGKEYSVHGDVNGNFKRIASKTGQSVYHVWMGHFAKHMDALENFINEPTREMAEPIGGRICDAVNYLLILFTLIVETNPEAVIEMVDYGDGVRVPANWQEDEGDGEGSQPLNRNEVILALRNPVILPHLNDIIVEYDETKERFTGPYSLRHLNDVLAEEIDELNREMWKRPTQRDRDRIIQEAVQVAATALHIIVEAKNGNR